MASSFFLSQWLFSQPSFMIDSEGCAIFIIPAKQAVQWKHFSSYFKKAEWEKKKRNGVRCGGNKSLGWLFQGFFRQIDHHCAHQLDMRADGIWKHQLCPNSLECCQIVSISQNYRLTWWMLLNSPAVSDLERQFINWVGIDSSEIWSLCSKNENPGENYHD